MTRGCQLRVWYHADLGGLRAPMRHREEKPVQRGDEEAGARAGGSAYLRDPGER